MITEIFNVLNTLVIILGILAAYWMGYRAGKGEEKLVERIPDMNIIETEKEEAPVSEEQIRAEMKYARTISSGYDIGEN